MAKRFLLAAAIALGLTLSSLAYHPGHPLEKAPKILCTSQVCSPSYYSSKDDIPDTHGYPLRLVSIYRVFNDASYMKVVDYHFVGILVDYLVYLSLSVGLLTIISKYSRR